MGFCSFKRAKFFLPLGLLHSVAHTPSPFPNFFICFQPQLSSYCNRDHLTRIFHTSLYQLPVLYVVFTTLHSSGKIVVALPCGAMNKMKNHYPGQLFLPENLGQHWSSSIPSCPGIPCREGSAWPCLPSLSSPLGSIKTKFLPQIPEDHLQETVSSLRVDTAMCSFRLCGCFKFVIFTIFIKA